jgi:sphingomyelin phosphodiesterase acid-like 3
MLRARTLALALLAATLVPGCFSQSSAPKPVKALLLSDIHFDPFRNPEQFAALAAADPEVWPSILAKPSAESTPEPCPSRGFDTDWPLLTASIQAEQAALPHPAFITLSGDLTGHEFDCRYKALGGAPAAYGAFAAKVVAFVAGQIRRAFPGTPVYFALGNNDSGCGDYFEDLGSQYLASVAGDFGASLPSAADRKSISTTLPTDAGNHVALPLPRTRLIILQNLFESVGYQSCARQPAPDAPAKQLAWLRKQLAAARATHQRVWLMAHIPTGVNVYSTLRNKTDICSGALPTNFLKTTELADLIAEYADVIKLAIFGHTHNDEIHLFTTGDGKRFVPAKIVPSISPINGNRPSFTVAEINPETATMSDYTVVTASNLTGKDATWSESYRFTKKYSEPDFSAASVADLAHKLTADHNGKSPEAQSYQHLWFPGDTGLHAAASYLLWPAYSCSITADHATDYRACMCPATPSTKPE